MASPYFLNKNVLLISPESWSHLFVSKHHYAIELSKNNQVYFLNPPTRSFAIYNTEYPNVKVIDYTPFISGLRFLPFWLQRFLMKRKFKRLQQIAGVNFDCIWSFDNSVFYDFSFLPKSTLKISHIVDYAQNFQFKKAASTADICFGVSKNIVDRLRENNPKSFLIPHGISLTRKEAMEIALPGYNPIKAMYAGNLDSKYIDTDLFFSLMKNHPEVDFILLGSGGSNWPRLKNTYYLGKVHHSELLNYLECADVLLLVYNIDDYPEQITNSHKILEYLQSGKVVLSTFIRDYKDKQDLIKMAITRDEFLSLFNEIISNLHFCNNEVNANLRSAFSITHSYSVRLKQIEDIIQNS